jgi:hypothetical protein
MSLFQISHRGSPAKKKEWEKRGELLGFHTLSPELVL